MKTVKIEGEYIVKCDISDMLKVLAIEMVKNPETVFFEIKSNFGGRLSVTIKKEELEDLRK